MTATRLIVACSLIWLLMIGAAAAGHWLAALFLLLPLLLAMGILGSSHKGRYDLKLVAFPTLVWLLLWACAFWLADYYARMAGGQSPEFTVLGFHPSFAAIVALFWIVPTLLMGFGFEAVKDRWLSEERWESFLSAVHDEPNSPEDP